MSAALYSVTLNYGNASLRDRELYYTGKWVWGQCTSFTFPAPHSLPISYVIVLTGMKYSDYFSQQRQNLSCIVFWPYFSSRNTTCYMVLTQLIRIQPFNIMHQIHRYLKLPRSNIAHIFIYSMWYNITYIVL